MKYDPRIATISEEEFNELVALIREEPPRARLTPDAEWRRDYRAAMWERRVMGVQDDLFGAPRVTHYRKHKPQPNVELPPRETVEEKLARIADDPSATFGPPDPNRPALTREEIAALVASAANWLRVGQRVRVASSPASIDGSVERRIGREGVVWRLCSPVFADHVYVFLDPVRAERAEKIAMVELRDVEPIGDGQ